MSADVLLTIIAGRETTGFIELRWPVRGSFGSGMGQSFHDLSTPHWLNSCRREIESLDGRTDVFVGAAPRTRREGGRAAVARAWCLWVDADSPGAVAKLGEFRHPPTLMIHSGSDNVLPNTHAWWALKSPVTPAAVEMGNRRLASVLGADMRATDAARIMRPPGTRNWKHKPPSPVEIASHEPVSYALADLVSNIPDPLPPRVVRESIDPRRLIGPNGDSDELASVPVETYYSVLTGREPLQGNSQCPWHGDGNERNPSLRLYSQTNTFYCFACDYGGGIYEFGAKVWGLGTRGDEFKELRRRLCEALGVAA